MIGTEAKHNRYGRGVIVEINTDADKITLRFDGGIKHLTISQTNLFFDDKANEEEYERIKVEAKINKSYTEAGLANDEFNKIEKIADAVGATAIPFDAAKNCKERIEEKRNELLRIKSTIGSVSIADLSGIKADVDRCCKDIKNDKDEMTRLLSSANAYRYSAAGVNAITNGTPARIEFRNKLISGYLYGNRIQDIIDDCVRIFAWNATALRARGCQPATGAQHATPEGYDVWFICYSNYCDEVRGAQAYYDQITSGNNEIVEYWFNSDEDARMGVLKKDPRVVFVKTREGSYLFLGVYQMQSVDVTNRKRIYKRISTEYPI